MENKITLGGVTYIGKLVTMDDVDIEDLVVDGKLDMKKVLKSSIIREDGKEIDWSKMPVGYSSRLTPIALRGCGFDGDGSEPGNG